MNKDRDIGPVIDYIRDEVIPVDHPVHARLGHLRVKLRYRAPEQWRHGWLDLGELLWDSLGDPAGCEWKERVDRFVSGKEKVVADDH